MKIAARSILIIETGEYSDKQWAGPFRVLKAFNQKAVTAAFCATWKAPKIVPWKTRPDPDFFVPWLIKRGYIEDMKNVTSWHIEDYIARANSSQSTKTEQD